MSFEKTKALVSTEPRIWETPRVRRVGDVADIVQGGSGKSSVTPTDPGEPNKVKPAQSSD